MFCDYILEMILADPEMRTIPVGCQSTAIHAIERILENYAKENKYASISELLSGNDVSA